MKGLLPGLLALVLIVMLVASYYYNLPNDWENSRMITSTDDQEQMLGQVDVAHLFAHIHELLHIKRSVLKQLRELEQKCSAVSLEVTELIMTTESLKAEISKLNSTSAFLRSSNKYQELAQDELKHKMSPKVIKPLRLTADSSDHYSLSPSDMPVRSLSCSMEGCFDYSRCPLTSGFPVFLNSIESTECRHDDRTSKIHDSLRSSPYVDGTSATEACLFVDFVCSNGDLEKLRKSDDWMGDGRNHLIVLGSSFPNYGGNFSRAMVLGTDLTDFRHGYDLQSVPFTFNTSIDELSSLPLTAPARRKRFIYFSGLCEGCNASFSAQNVVRSLLDMKAAASYVGTVDLSFSCKNAHDGGVSCHNGLWCMCESDSIYDSKLKESTFSLIITTGRLDPMAVRRVMLGLKNGAVPVILGSCLLPLDENIDWHRVVIQLPRARVTELHNVLYAIRDEDILQYRNQGRQVWQKYFSSAASFSAALLDTLRVRLNIPAIPAREVALVAFFNYTSPTSAVDLVRTDIEENVGPIEPSYPSDTFQHNFTSTTLGRYSSWNDKFDAGMLVPSSPFSSLLPGDAQVRGSSFGFRPIGGGAGGSGNEFNEAIGGNCPREQFTVVILTYQREAILSSTVARLNNLPYLNKVIIVWNSQLEPSDLLAIPKIHVPVVIHKAPVNSLNNRFLPFDAIETEAILSMDDDIQLRHDEIVFAFRVWRENRDRIVGFPARYHARDAEHNSWLYNSNYTCEYSMILTGAAFFHKYYTFLYTFEMPAAIRTKVDEFMNCEDIAMNFLVSHVTRKPPIKVTSRWTFRCQDCPISLWEDDSHFTERHSCIEFFENIYGYMPLLNSQFRADSVLFKTRIPADKQKCYRLI